MMTSYNINRTTLRILALFLSDYGRSRHLREVAREAGVDVKAVQLQLGRLEDNNILTSTVRGRNKVYSLRLDNVLVRYYLTLAEVFVSVSFLGRNFAAKKVVEQLLDLLEGVVILFGSFAREEATEDSDVDLLFLGEKPRPVIPWGPVRETEARIGREINVKSATKDQFMNWLENGEPFVKEVLGSHIVLKGHDSFCGLVWRYYAKR